MLPQEVEAASQGCGVHDQDFRDGAYGNWLVFGNGGQDSELRGADARLLEGVIVESCDSAAGTAKIEGSAIAGAGEVELRERGRHKVS